MTTSPGLQLRMRARVCATMLHRRPATLLETDACDGVVEPAGAVVADRPKRGAIGVGVVTRFRRVSFQRFWDAELERNV
jgi:hypothetical protein